MKAIDIFERFAEPTYNGQDYLKNHIFDRYPVVNCEEEISEWEGYSDYVWLFDPDIKVFDSFPWYFKPNVDEELAIHAFPYVYKKSRRPKDWSRVQLIPTKPGTYKTIRHTNIVGEYDVYKGKDRFDIFYIGTNLQSFNLLKERFDNIQVVQTIEQAQQQSYTDMLWVVHDDTIVRNTFKFSYVPDEWSFDYVHVFGNGDIDRLDGIALFPKHYNANQREHDYRFYANKKEVRIMASVPRPYDRFEINSYEQYLEALEKSTTDMFWGVPQDVDIAEDFDFSYTIGLQQHSDKEKNHVWLNGTHYDGIVLFSKSAPVTEKEINHRFLVNRIEHKQVASYPKPFDVFTIDSYNDYLDARKHSTTGMFWGVPSDVDVRDDFLWQAYFDDKPSIDRTTNHLFLNGEHYDGIVLFSVFADIATEKEVAHRFYLNKKEHEYIATYPKPYDIFTIDCYEDYIDALYNATSEMFWSVPSDIVKNKDFDFDMYFSHHNQYDRNLTHVFLNDKTYDGIVLHSKNVVVTEKEVEHRFYIKKKEWDIVASKPLQYPCYVVNTYDDYIQAREDSSTEMFWMINDDIDVNEDFDFDFYISHHDQFNRKINHLWKNGKYYDGVVLTTKKLTLSQREVDFRFYAARKEYEESGSTPKTYDIVFISNSEANADSNYKLLKDKYPHAKRVDKVKGIHQAHIAAANLCDTEMFWVVDGDAQIIDDFEFDYQIARYDLDGRQTVHVWRSFNPVNSLVYGYGGVKLLPTELTRNVDVKSPDMTTSISDKFKGIDRMSNTTAFNTDAFSAWRSGFRECVKLSSRVIDRQKDEETKFRLDAWCTRGADKPFGEYAIAGAILGREYGEHNKNNKAALAKINDFDWLQEQFAKSSYQQVE
jgi:hypothetical protein